jgi:hypothetical protein
MSSHVPGSVSTYNEEMAPLIDKLKQSYVPVDVKAAFNQLLEHLHNDELDACIEAGEELLKKRIPDTTRTRVHILIASCLADPDEMEEHYEKALHLWTLLNAEHANTRIDPWLREARAQLDALFNAIQEERNDETTTEETTTELTMSDIAVVESVPTLAPSSISSSDHSSSYDSEPDSGNMSERSHTTRMEPTDISPARSSASLHASSIHMTVSRLFGAIASPGHQTVRLYDHVGMSPAGVLKFAWDPNRTVRTVTSSKRLPSRPLKRRASSTSKSPSESPRPARDTEEYFRDMFEPPSPPKLKLPKGSGRYGICHM